MEVQFHQEGSEMELDDQKSIFLFRIFQESLNNILKHAGATEVIVNVSFLDNIFVLEIKDNGVGFNLAEKQLTASSSSGVGLKSIFNRAKLIGADLSIDSKPGSGTTILIELPLLQD